MSIHCFRNRGLNMTNSLKPPRGFLEKFPGSSFIVIAICVTLTLFVGFLDYATGGQMHFFLFYLIPIAISAWFAGIWAAVFFVLLSVVAGLFADMLSSHHHSPGLSNGGMRGFKGSHFHLRH